MYKTKTQPNKGKLIVEIFYCDDKVGEYTRNYPQLYNTFVPFRQDKNDYALYSEIYDRTSVMRLPSCEKIAEEQNVKNGFCPTGFYVPQSEFIGLKDNYCVNITGPSGGFGFVCGCYWGDDNDWKLQFLDLSEISGGIIKRDARFGRLPVGSCFHLEEDITVSDYSKKEDCFVTIKTHKNFRIDGKLLDD